MNTLRYWLAMPFVLVGILCLMVAASLEPDGAMTQKPAPGRRTGRAEPGDRWSRRVEVVPADEGVWLDAVGRHRQRVRRAW